jgi:hypothetical protein
MPPPTTPPNPTGDWLTINADGSVTINNPPLATSTARNDNKSHVAKEQILLPVPCSLASPFLIYRAQRVAGRQQADQDLNHFQSNPTSPFPFPALLVEAMGQDGLFQGKTMVKGSINSVEFWI